MAAKSIQYVEMDPLEHCLLRPDTYIGSIRTQERSDWIMAAESEEYRLVYQSMQGNAGLERLFIEAQSNAIDNVWRSSEAGVKQSFIAFELDPATGWTSVANDGLLIDIEEKHESGEWKPEFIVGKLRTSSNYNDAEDRKTSGKNGLGIKLTNIYSLEFKIDIVDKEHELRYEQTWSNHMKSKTKAVVTKLKKTQLKAFKSSYTKVSWRPDFPYFSLEGYTADMLALLLRYACDTAMITGVKVTMNESPVPMTQMKQYVKALHSEESLLLESPECKVAICSSDEFRQLSYVNGCFTADGGAHVDAWVHDVLKPVQEKIETKLKIKLSLRDIKKFFTFVVVANVVRPEFTSQTKQCYVGPSIKPVVEDKHINAIMKWDFMKKVNDEAKMKEMSSLKKTEKRGYTKVEGLDPANLAVTAKSRDCVLVICEGESAKTYTVAGLDVGMFGKIGRDYIGIYPIRGKILNSRNATIAQIQDNREITGIRMALGLQHGVDYSQEEHYKKLRYGKVVVISDADTDGKHITGLILNVFHSMYPSLVSRGDFLFAMRTPIMTVTLGKTEKDMYSQLEYDTMVKTLTAAQIHAMKVKWRKGLGSSKRDEVKKSFGQRMVRFHPDEATDANLIKAFDKKFADQRKSWMVEFSPHLEAPRFEEKTEVQPISHFINYEFIEFSMEDCSRSLPHVMDGLKESQRKVLYTCFKKNLYTQTMKVAQLGGAVAELTQYHHGEQNLYETVIKLAQDFVGSNNLPYLYQDGQFGTRIDGGKDAAAARYIFTRLEKHMKLLFRAEDEPIYTYVQVDGETVEPVCYAPILPMMLVNGCSGIGTGWSSDVPCFNPMDLIQWIVAWIEDEADVASRPDLVPWYKGFKGSITMEAERAVTRGVFGVAGKKKESIEITELPIGLWTDKYKCHVEDWYEAKAVSHRANYSKVDSVHFVITPESEFEVSDKNLKLISYLSLNNMVAFNTEGRIHRYKTVVDILIEYCTTRLVLYEKRKAHQVKQLDHQIRVLSNKIRFLNEVMAEDLVIFKKSEDWVESELIRRKYDKEESTFTYLLHLPIQSFTQEKINGLTSQQASLQHTLDVITRTSPKEMWKSELFELKTYLQKP